MGSLGWERQSPRTCSVVWESGHRFSPASSRPRAEAMGRPFWAGLRARLILTWSSVTVPWITTTQLLLAEGSPHARLFVCLTHCFTGRQSPSSTLSVKWHFCLHLKNQPTWPVHSMRGQSPPVSAHGLEETWVAVGAPGKLFLPDKESR